MIEPYKPRRDVRPYYVSCLDIETDPAGVVIGVGFAWEDERGQRQYEAFDGWGDWLDFYIELHDSLKSRSPLHSRLARIYAHNGAGFDWLSFIRWAENNEQIETLRFISSGSTGIGIDMRIASVKRVIHLRDSFRLMPQSLGGLCKAFKTEHQKIDIDELPHLVKARDEDLFWSYLENDVLAMQEVLYAFWSMIYQEVGSVEDLPMTLPALAMKIWRKTLEKPMFVTWNEKLRTLERRAYSGGRTECFRPGVVDDARVYDINSQYPAVMFDAQMPVSYRGFWVRKYQHEHGIYDLKFVQHDRSRRPVLRDETSGEFRYQGAGVYTHPEIEELLKAGGEIEVTKGYVYIDIGNPFRKFIETWYLVKLTAERMGDSALRFVAKILMNSLYGKFGQHEKQWVLKLVDKEKQKWMLEKGIPFKNLGRYTLVLEESHSDYTFCAVAAYITSYARLNLLNWIDQFEENGGEAVYCDTDSVHGSGAELPESDALGAVKLEYRGAAAYAGRKLYALKGNEQYDQKFVHKGVVSKKDRSNRLLTYDDFEKLATDTAHKIEIVYTTFPTYLEVMSGKCEPAVMTTRRRTIRQTTGLHIAAD